MSNENNLQLSKFIKSWNYYNTYNNISYIIQELQPG